MVLPIGGFMPIPLAMMIPFMATQSMVMGDAFGRAFQYGKRKISAMSNEEFNATSLEAQASEMFKSYKIIIGDNHLQRAIQESQTLQETIIREMLLILPRFSTSDAFLKPEPFDIGGAKTIQDAIAHSMGGHMHPDFKDTTTPTEEPEPVPPSTGGRRSPEPPKSNLSPADLQQEKTLQATYDSMIKSSKLLATNKANLANTSNTFDNTDLRATYKKRIEQLTLQVQSATRQLFALQKNHLLNYKHYYEYKI